MRKAGGRRGGRGRSAASHGRRGRTKRRLEEEEEEEGGLRGGEASFAPGTAGKRASEHGQSACRSTTSRAPLRGALALRAPPIVFN